MNILNIPEAMRLWSRNQRATHKRIGFVPTMGALHEGHASLIRRSVTDNDRTVVSIFVNPTQFAPNEDFEEYPRTWDADLALCEELGVDAIYHPQASTLYPEGYATYVDVENVSEGLCGSSRPHFFRGVATVVTKLFNAVEPDRAYFGQKDAQQAAVIIRMTRDLDLGIDIVVMPIVREADGLALSSRNRYLNPEERERALAISKGLFAAKEMLDAGERDGETLIEAVRRHLDDHVAIDYVELVDAETMQPVSRVAGPVVLAVAAFVGMTRLIDNIRYPDGS